MNNEELERFIKAVEEMRRLQISYFKERLPGDLQRAKQWEREVDKMIAKYRDGKKPVPDAVQGSLL